MKIFKKLFYQDRISLIKRHFKVTNPDILEIGVFKGDLSKKLFDVFKPNNLTLVDPWKAQSDSIYKDSWYAARDSNSQKIQDKYFNDLKEFFREDILNKKVSIFKLTSENYFKSNKSKFDLIYIDGNHLYEFVLNDILNSLNSLNENGMIVLDDYKTRGWWKDGVTKAVNYLQKKEKIRIITKHNLFNYHNQCIITKN